MKGYGSKSTTSKVSRRFVKRTARRIPRSINLTGVIMRVEYDDLLAFYNTDTQPRFEMSSTSYTNFSAILLANPAFVSQAQNFMRYKVNSCSFNATPCYADKDLSTAFTAVGCPVICIQQYPILASSSVGSEAIYSDNNLVIKPNDLSQSKYWPYKSNFMIGTGSGVGTWNQTNAVASQQGQVSCRAPNPNSTYVCTGVIYLYATRITLSISLDGKSR
jgi:hypothetical protein